MRRPLASVISGIVVGLLMAIFSWSFLMAATWSSIHGGMSQITLAILSVVALAIPPASGFLVGRAVFGWTPRRKTKPMSDSLRESLRLDCPHCGCSMELAAEDADTQLYTVVECPIHGPYHFSPDTGLTLGRPRQP